MSLLKNKIVKNASWIIASKVAQSIIGLVISMLTARFLGPSNYGLINYAESVVSFLTPVMSLGFSHVLVQELTNHPEEEGKILGTSILLSLFSSFACICGILIFTFIADMNEPLTHLVVGLYSLLLIVYAFDLLHYWYQAKLMSKYTAIVSFFAYVIVACYKVFLLIVKASVALFAVSNVIDYLIISVALLIIYKKLGGQKISFSSEIGKRMFNKSKHYIVSSLMVTIFAQTDKIMAKQMINEEAVGYYSAAIRCAGMTSFVFTAIIDSFRPVIFSHKKENDIIGYEKNIERLYCVIIYLSLAQSIAMTIFSGLIINVLYGNQYQQSVLALQILVWYTTFSYLGSVRNIWILGENKQKYLWILNLGGALMNIILNLIFINIWGIYGAAAASLLTQFFTNVIMNYIVWPLRHNNTLILKSLNPLLIVDIFRRKKDGINTQ